MLATLLIAAGVICGILTLLAFLGVLAHGMVVTLLIATIICLVLGVVLQRGRVTL